MPILYSLVARQKAVLAEFTSSSGNFPTVTRVLLAKIPDSDSKMSYVYDKYVFHYIVDQGITFLCMSDESTKRRITFAFLEDIKKAWRENFTAVERTALPFSLNEAFSPVLRQKLVIFPHFYVFCSASSLYFLSICFCRNSTTRTPPPTIFLKFKLKSTV